MLLTLRRPRTLRLCISADSPSDCAAEQMEVSIADSGAGARGGGSAPNSAAANAAEGEAEQENQRDGVGEKAGKDSALVLGLGRRRLCVAEQEHERDGMGDKDGPSQHSRPDARLGLVNTRVPTHAPPSGAGEEGLGRGGEGKGVESATGGRLPPSRSDNRGAKRKMAERCEVGLKRGDRKERDTEGQIKGNNIFKL